MKNGETPHYCVSSSDAIGRALASAGFDDVVPRNKWVEVHVKMIVQEDGVYVHSAQIETLQQDVAIKV